MNLLRYVLLLLVLTCASLVQAQQPFAAGNIVVYRIGNGSVALNGTATTVYIDEFTPSGTLVQSIPMPTTGNKVTTGTFNSWGLLNLSANGKYLVVPGFDAAPGASFSVTQPQSIGVVDFNGRVGGVTVIPNTSLNGITSATSDDGSRFWFTTADEGINYTPAATTNVTKLYSSPIQSTSNITIVNGQLYVSNGAGYPEIATVGTGLPTTAGQTLTALPGIDGPNDDHVRQFAFADLNPSVPGNDVVYLASMASGGGGLQKYSLVNGTWTLNGTIGATADRYHGLAIQTSGNTVTVFATRRGANSLSIRGGELVKLTDNSGYNGALTGTPTVISAAPTANTLAYRGVALVPQPAPFTGGNIVVYRIGDGTAALDGTAARVYLDEMTPAGTLVQSILMPTTGNRITMGTVNTGGLLNLSANGKFLAVPGFETAVGSNLNLPQPRSIGVIDFNGKVTGITTIPNTGLNAINSATTDDGTRLWYTAADEGLSYTPAGVASPVSLFSSTVSTSNVSIVDGQLYMSNGAGIPEIAKVGVGLPTTPGQSLAALPGIDGPNDDHVRQFAFADLSAAVPGNDVLYLASMASAGGGLQKYSLVNGSWKLNGTIGATADRYHGLAIKLSAGTVRIFASRRGSNSASFRGGEVVSLQDNSGYDGAFAGTPTVIANVSTANTMAYRGIALVPQGCPAVKSLQAINITASQATISFAAPAGTSGNYEYQVSTNPAPPSSGTATSSLSPVVTGLVNNTSYYAHVRTVCSANGQSEWSTVAFVTSCKAPALPQIRIATTVTGIVTVSWPQVFGAASYEYILSTSATPTGAGTAITDTALVLSNLSATTQYYIHIRSNCGGGAFSPWATRPFTTDCFAPAPTIVSADKNAGIRWNKAGNVTRFEYALTRSSNAPASGKLTTDTSYTSTSVRSGGSYYFHIRSVCAGGKVSEWNTIPFNANGLLAYPNPVTDRLQIRLHGLSSNSGEAIVVDAMGRTVAKVRLAGGAASILTLHWAPGVYTVLYNDGSQMHSVRILKP